MKQQARSADPESITSSGNTSNDSLKMFMSLYMLLKEQMRCRHIHSSVDSEPDIDEQLETEIAEETAMEMWDGSEKVAKEIEHITANVRNMGQGSQGEDVGLKIPVVQVDVGMRADYKDCVLKDDSLRNWKKFAGKNENGFFWDKRVLKRRVNDEVVMDIIVMPKAWRRILKLTHNRLSLVGSGKIFVCH